MNKYSFKIYAQTYHGCEYTSWHSLPVNFNQIKTVLVESTEWGEQK